LIIVMELDNQACSLGATRIYPWRKIAICKIM